MVALLGYLAGAPLLGAVATGAAFAAAFLNAAFGFCLGCEMYLLGKRSPPTPRLGALTTTDRHPSRLKPT